MLWNPSQQNVCEGKTCVDSLREDWAWNWRQAAHSPGQWSKNQILYITCIWTDHTRRALAHTHADAQTAKKSSNNTFFLQLYKAKMYTWKSFVFKGNARARKGRLKYDRKLEPLWDKYCIVIIRRNRDTWIMWTKRQSSRVLRYLLSRYINTEKERKAVTFHLQVGIVFVSSQEKKWCLWWLRLCESNAHENISSCISWILQSKGKEQECSTRNSKRFYERDRKCNILRLKHQCI